MTWDAFLAEEERHILECVCDQCGSAAKFDNMPGGIPSGFFKAYQLGWWLVLMTDDHDAIKEQDGDVWHQLSWECREAIRSEHIGMMLGSWSYEESGGPCWCPFCRDEQDRKARQRWVRQWLRSRNQPQPPREVTSALARSHREVRFVTPNAEWDEEEAHAEQ